MITIAGTIIDNEISMAIIVSPAEGQREYERRIREQNQLVDLVRSLMSQLIGNDKKNSKIIELIVEYTREHWTYFICGQPLRQVNFEIGGQKIDQEYGKWLNLWSELHELQPQQQTISRRYQYPKK